MRQFLKRTLIVLFTSICLTPLLSENASPGLINVLQNPGFEALGWPPANWSEWSGAASGNPADGAYGYIEAKVVHSGLQSAARGLYGSGIRWGGYSQDAQVRERESVTASGWLMSPAKIALKNGAAAYIELKFLDGSNKELAVYKSGQLTSASSWVKRAITKTAPTGTQIARFSFVLYGGSTKAAGLVYFDDAALEVDRDTTPPVVTITSPADGALTNTTLIRPTGTVDDTTVTSINVNGKIEQVYSGSWYSYVSLAEGSNTITAKATDAAGNVGSKSITVYLDTVAPVVTIISPEDQSTTENSPITVNGTVDDPQVASVNVNGKIESVMSGSWSSSVSLVEGANVITVQAADRAGNAGSDSITVYFNPPNLVQNPGFEDSSWPPLHWSEWAGSGSGSPSDGVAGYLTPACRTGALSAARKLYGSGIRWGGYSQDIAVGGWDLVRASCYLMSSPSDDPLANGATAYIEIKFFDGNNKELGLYKSASLTTATSTWMQYTIERCAPKNAAKVRLSLVLVGNLDNAAGTAYFDDASLKVIPGSSAPEPKIPFDKPQSTGTVQISARTLLVNGKPFTMKGVCYQPTPVGYYPWEHYIYGDPAIYNRDLPILRDMGVNTIRLYTKITTAAFLDACYNNGVGPIYVVMGYYIDGHNDFGNKALRDSIKNDFRNYVNTYKNYPAILMWSPGNETECTYAGCDYEYYTFLNELAEVAYIEEGNAYHPVTAVVADISNIGDSNLLATDDDMDYLDVWGSNVYRGLSFGDLFDDYAARSSKVFWISEFGVDAWHVIDKYSDPANGYLDESSQDQWDIALWDEIASRGDVSSGGTVFEYSDEWWKDQYRPPASHDYQGFPTSDSIVHPDQYSNEEWYGVVSVSGSETTPDIITEREAYYGLQSRWLELPKMHIQDIGMSLIYSGAYVKAQAIIYICDEGNAPLAGAVVSGLWSGLTSGADSGQTDGAGRIIFESDRVRNPRSGSQFIFTVTDVVLDGCVYESLSNTETSDSIAIP